MNVLVDTVALALVAATILIALEVDRGVHRIPRPLVVETVLPAAAALFVGRVLELTNMDLASG